MKKIVLVLATLFVLSGMVFAGDIVESFAGMAEKLVDVESIGGKPRFAFATLSSDTEAREKGEYITDALMEAVFDTGKIRIIERSKLDNIMTELHLQSSGLIDEDTAKEIGKVAGVDYICYGNFSLVDGLYFVKVKVTDVQSGELCALASDYIFPDAYLTESDGVAKSEEKPAKKEKVKKEPVNKDYLGFFITYDAPVPDVTKGGSITIGPEQRVKNLVMGPSLGMSLHFNDPGKLESNYIYGFLNFGYSISVFHLKGGVGYGFDTTPNEMNSILAHGQAGITLKKLRLEYSAEYNFAYKNLEHKVSIGLISKAK